MTNMHTNSKLCERFALLISIVLAAFLCSSGFACAENAENPLTWNGLTVYGTVDIGVSYQSHGRPQNDYFSAGGYTFPNKASTDSSSQFSHNGIGLSVLGKRPVSVAAQYSMKRTFAPGRQEAFADHHVV